MTTSPATVRSKLRSSELPYGVVVYQPDDDEWTLAARFLLARDAWSFRDSLAPCLSTTTVDVCVWDDAGAKAIEHPATGESPNSPT